MPKIISIARWRPLYALAQQIAELRPWETLQEQDVFAVHDPRRQDADYISVMGNLEQHHAVSVYTGTAGWSGFANMQMSEEELDPIEVFSTPQLQLSFEDKDELLPEDLLIIDELEFKPRDRHVWPMFRSYRPGYAPWFLENDEIEHFHTVLEQAVVVLQDRQRSARIVECLKQDQMLVRVGTKVKYDVQWQYQEDAIPAIMGETVITMAPKDILFAAAALPRSMETLYVDFRMLLTPVFVKGEDRPYLPFLLVYADTESKLILRHQVFRAENGWQDLLADLSNRVLDDLLAIGHLPKKLYVRSAMLYELLITICENLSLPMERVEEMPEVEELIREMQNVP